MKIEFEISDRLYEKVSIAAKNLNVSKQQFFLMATRKLALENQVKQESDREITSKLNKFFEEHPEANIPWWKDRSWDDVQPTRKVDEK
jgi:hypothetical protein